MANKQAAEEQWKDQWDQKKKNFQLEQELKKQEQKIKDLEFRLKEEEKLKSKDS
jgi:peptidoglycan hydrolase CwlO-like protein